MLQVRLPPASFPKQEKILQAALDVDWLGEITRPCSAVGLQPVDIEFFVSWAFFCQTFRQINSCGFCLC